MIDFIFAAITGFVFSILTSIMIFLLIKNTRKGLKNNRVYFIPCFSIFITFLSFLLLNVRIQTYDNYIFFLLGGSIFYVFLSIILYSMLCKFDRIYLKNLSPSKTTYLNTPRSYIFVASTTSSSTILILIAWVIYICFMFEK